ncbi:MAG: ParB/RepB/Spo0J family partition protein [Propylenella sp.]
MALALEQKRRLGRGLDALLGAYPAEAEEPSRRDTGRRTVPIAFIERNPRNPRRDFADAELDELAASLTKHGIVQPLVVREIAGVGERYEIIAGERRWRAAQRAGLHEVPVTVLDVSDREALELAIVENVQRTDLNPVEEARGYQALIEEFQYSQATLGETIGKSRVHVTNTLRLLKLPTAVLEMLETGALSAGHGRALLSAADPEKLARLVVVKGLSVRETERLAQEPAEAARPKIQWKPQVRNADIAALEKELADLLGLKVELRHQDSGRGELRITYATLEQLDLICRRLRR